MAEYFKTFHFFRDVHGIYPITKEALAKRTNEYRQWVEAFGRNHQIPIEWPQKNIKNEDYVRPYCLSMERSQRFGVYFIFKSLEQGPTFRSLAPKYPTDDPRYRIIRQKRSRFTHYYFYIRDEVLAPKDAGLLPRAPKPHLIVSAFDASNGKLVWQKPAPAEQPFFGTASSPVAAVSTQHTVEG